MIIFKAHYEKNGDYICSVTKDTVTGLTLVGTTDSRKNQRLEELHRKQPKKLKKAKEFFGVHQWEIKSPEALEEVCKILEKPENPVPERKQNVGAGAQAE